ncbi:MAG: Asp-tRNA(Asn)/Glu-tRNA(Gln) amidotransferase GatCAB subunit B, partial [Chloroflexi bacterium]|nr:Asp-tRNA(Asn)/Glu-tRNA(Gln) amidotransferase GatCAB subunit B [Chloroflexota bacterium]
ASGETVEQVRFEPGRLMELLDLIDAGTLSTSMAKTVFEEMFDTGVAPKEIVESSGMAQIGDADAIRPAIEQAVESNPKPVADYLQGKETALRYLVGQVMKITRGKANPQLATQLLEEKLEAMR